MLQRVQKIISQRGYCSRRKAEDLIMAGKVRVNNNPVKIGDKADEKDSIEVEGKTLVKEHKRYMMLNKPLNCICATTDNQYKTVIDIVKPKERLYPVGRLDYNTTGLVILTNDGEFANKVMHPAGGVKKSYVVTLDKSFANRDEQKLKMPIRLDDGPVQIVSFQVLSDKMIKVRVEEGRKRVVRRVFRAIGYKVISLERTAIGRLDLGNLPKGKWKDLTRKDIKLIFQ